MYGAELESTQGPHQQAALPSPVRTCLASEWAPHTHTYPHARGKSRPQGPPSWGCVSGPVSPSFLGDFLEKQFLPPSRALRRLLQAKPAVSTAAGRVPALSGITADSPGSSLDSSPCFQNKSSGRILTVQLLLRPPEPLAPGEGAFDAGINRLRELPSRTQWMCVA